MMTETRTKIMHYQEQEGKKLKYTTRKKAIPVMNGEKKGKYLDM